MDIRGVDPRDQTWELPDPRYRVYFFDQAAGWSSEYELVADDVAEVLDWAKGESGDRTYVVYACVPEGGASGGLGLVRLLGADPFEDSDDPFVVRIRT